MNRIDQAIINLYGGLEQIPESSQIFLREIIGRGKYQDEYGIVRQEEVNNKKMLIEFEDQYPGVTNSENVDSIIGNLKRKHQNRKQTIDLLRHLKQEEQEIDEDELER